MFLQLRFDSPHVTLLVFTNFYISPVLFTAALLGDQGKPIWKLGISN